MQQLDGQKRKIRVAFGSPWKTTHPGLQHTLVGDLVLSNQFEALVGMNEFGVAVPLAAKSWDVSEDFKTFTFHIDTSKTFSDGERLSARDFKRSWEDALALEPKSNNSSLLDIMYKIRGFSDFPKTKTLSGIEVVDDSTLRVHFDSPFRMALSHFMGNRFAVYKEKEGRFLGTGKFVIAEHAENDLFFAPNPRDPDAKSLPSIEVSVVKTDEAVARLLDGTIDVFAYGRGSSVSPTIKGSGKLSVVVGQDALHETTILNLLPGKFFHNRQHRLAMQYLIHKTFTTEPALLGNTDYSSVDAQVFLPLQPGRISDQEVERIVAQGERFVSEMIAATKKHPLLVYTSESDDWLLPLLREIGVAISPDSKKISPQERINVIYKSHEPDVIVTAFGVASGDPDGVYHRLGKSGAIMSPMCFSERVSALLEEGRKLARQDQLDPFYQGVNRAILEEVPFVHLGYSKAVAIYRNDAVDFDSKLLRRNEGHLHGFRLR